MKYEAKFFVVTWKSQRLLYLFSKKKKKIAAFYSTIMVLLSFFLNLSQKWSNWFLLLLRHTADYMLDRKQRLLAGYQQTETIVCGMIKIWLG